MYETKRRLDWVLLLELALAFALVVLGVVLYWRPAAYGLLTPRWWHGGILAVLFFLLVWIDGRRRRRRRHTTLHRALDEVRPEA